MILPGLLCDSTMFAGALEAFASARAIDDHYNGADRIEDMAEHVLAQAPKHFALIGHSMGARVALEVVARAPHRVTRLMLADTGIHGVAAGEAEKRHALRDIGRGDGFGQLVEAWLPPMVGPAGRQDRALMATLRAMCLRASQSVFEAQIEALLHRPDATRVLRDIDCPTMVVVGAQDQWSPVEQHQPIVDQIAGAQLRILADAGHMAPAEQPQKFNALIREWLQWQRQPHAGTIH